MAEEIVAQPSSRVSFELVIYEIMIMPPTMQDSTQASAL